MLVSDKSKTKKEVLEDITECPKYCILKEIIAMNGFNNRLLEQVKCLEKFKYEESERQGRDIGLEDATKLWIRKGYAQKFDEIYIDGMKHKEIYEKLMGNKSD